MRALVALDLGEETPEDVLGDALVLLDRMRATVGLAYVDDALDPSRHDAWRRRLEGLLARVEPERRAEVLVAARRDVAQAVVDQTPGHDLLVVGTHGRRGPVRLWLGSVAERVVRSSAVPVLVVRGRVPALAAGGPARLLAAVDLDDGADALAAEATRFALAFRATVDAVTALRPIVPEPDGLALGVDWLALRADLEENARVRLGRWLERLPAEIRGSARVVHGEPATAIVGAAEGALLVLVGTHGRRGAVRFWLGSVAERVTRLAPVPVLVAPLVLGKP